MNQLFVGLGIESWKGALGALVLPPLPLLLLAALGAVLLPRRRRLGQALVLGAVALLWAACAPGVGATLIGLLTRPPAALTAERIAGLAGAPKTAVLVLGAGRKLEAPEYRAVDLKPLTLERLRYGLWLARQTGLPVGYSGGIGHGSGDGPTESDAARLVAQRDFGVALRWLESRSRDTHENARYSVAMLHADGIERVLLVTHGFHQQRALAAFARAIRQQGATLQVIAAPMGLQRTVDWELGDLLPNAEGLTMTWLALHEWLGWLAGA
ncbi:MAG: YdcF family protein [Burkholderiaceae bacterium]|nr:YdcF family protein [Burkholderiaceae bacterium]